MGMRLIISGVIAGTAYKTKKGISVLWVIIYFWRFLFQDF